MALCAGETTKLEAELETVAGNDDGEQRMVEIYAPLEKLDRATAKVRAAKIPFGLGFNDAKQAQVTSSFSAPTNHLAGVFAKIDKILLMVSHSQDLMNEVCTAMIHVHQHKLRYYTGNFDSFVETRADLDANQRKRYER